MNGLSGYIELAHMADWSLRVWAPDLAGLLTTAAGGMYALMETRLYPAPQVERTLSLAAYDAESLLVAFLGELLYLAEEDGLGFDRIDLALEGLNLRAVLRGTPIVGQSKLIKAVTFHKLVILSTANGLETTIVFDV